MYLLLDDHNTPHGCSQDLETLKTWCNYLCQGLVTWHNDNEATTTYPDQKQTRYYITRVTYITEQGQVQY